MSVFTDILKAKLETLLGERGNGNEAAVRRKDLDALLDKAAARALALAKGTGSTEAKAAAAAAASAKAAADDAAAAVAAMEENQTEAFADLERAISEQTRETTGTLEQVSRKVFTVEASQAASVILRAKAGTAGAELELAAGNDPNGAVSTARIAADDIVLDGTVKMKHVVITDLSGNLIPNGAFAFNDLRGWGTLPSTFTLTARDTGSAVNAIATAPTNRILRMNQDVANNQEALMASFACAPGERFIPSFMWAGQTTTTATIGIICRFYDAAGALISSFLRSVTAAGEFVWSLPVVGSVVIAPANAVRCDVFARRSADGGAGAAFLTNMELRKQVSGAITITPRSITGAELIDTQAVITQTAQMGNATVQTLAIGSQAVSADWNVATTAAISFGGASGGSVNSITINDATTVDAMAWVTFSALIEITRVTVGYAEPKVTMGGRDYPIRVYIPTANGKVKIPVSITRRLGSIPSVPYTVQVSASGDFGAGDPDGSGYAGILLRDRTLEVNVYKR